MTHGFSWQEKSKQLFSMEGLGPGSPTWCCLSWFSDWHVNDGFLADEFKRAGDYVIAHLERAEGSRNADGLFMPVAFLYRHALELTLKQTVRLAVKAGLLKQNSRIDRALRHHTLNDLWTLLRPVLESEWPHGDKQILANIETFVGGFQRVDKSGQNLRYSRDFDDQATHRTYPRSVELLELKDAYEGVHNLLAGCSDHLSSILEWLAEAERK